MTFLAGLGLSLVLLVFGLLRRHRSGLPLDSAYASKLVWVSLGLGMAVGTIAFPAFWLLILFSVRGGTIESNLPPGTDARFLLVLLLVGTLMTLVYTAFGYRDHVFPYSLVRGTATREEEADNVEPLERRPEDRPPS